MLSTVSSVLTRLAAITGAIEFAFKNSGKAKLIEDIFIFDFMNIQLH